MSEHGRLASEKSSGFRCPRCDGPMAVKDSRQAPDGMVRRRRACVLCLHRVSTYETIFDEGDKIIGLSGMKDELEAAIKLVSGLQDRLSFIKKFTDLMDEMKDRT